MTLPIGRRPNRLGYTLIELILLAVIIVILVGISTPLFRKTFSDLVFEDALFNISKLIGFAQEKAIVEGIPYKLVLDTDKAQYYLIKSDLDSSGKYIRLKEKFGRAFSLPKDIKIKTDKKEVVFYPDGHNDKAVITFLGKTKGLKMTLKGSLGYVEIKETLK